MRVTILICFFFSLKVFSQEQPSLDTFNLRNGLKVYLLNYAHDSILNVKLVIDGGQKNERSCQVGYSAIIQNLIAETLKEKQKSIFKKRKKISCEISEGQTSIIGNCFVKDFSKQMNLLSSTLLKLTFKSNTIDRITTTVIDSYSPEKLSKNMVFGAFTDLFLYGAKNPLGRHYCQYAIQKVLPYQLRDFYYEHYNPKNTSLIICGNFDKEEVRKLVIRYFSRWKTLRKEEKLDDHNLKPLPIKNKTIAFINKRDQKLFYLKWIQNAPCFKSPDQYAFRVTCVLFDRFIHENLNAEKTNDSLYFRKISYLNNFTEIECSAKNELNKIVTAFDSILLAFRAKTFTESDLLEAINSSKQNSFKDTSVAGTLAFYTPLTYNFDSRIDYKHLLSSVKISNIQALQKNYFSPNAYRLIIVGREGPVTDLLASQKKIIKYQSTDFQTCDETCVPPKERWKPHCEQARLFCRNCWKLGRFWGKNRC